MYYIYQNWVAHKNSGKIHKSTCSFCNNGQGRTTEEGVVIDGKSGVWIGPFETYALAEGYLISNNFIECSSCPVCIK